MATNSSITNKNTRYTKGGVTIVNGNHIGWWHRRVLPQSADDTTMVIGPKYDRNPHLLAYDVYGKTELGWLILQYNNIIDQTTEFLIGATIRLPLPRRILMSLE